MENCHNPRKEVKEMTDVLTKKMPWRTQQSSHSEKRKPVKELYKFQTHHPFRRKFPTNLCSQLIYLIHKARQ